MTSEAWRKMEALASAMTNARYAKERKFREKLSKRNELHSAIPSTNNTQAEENNSSMEQEKTDPIIYNSAWYVLNYLTPHRKRSKKK